jgi:hypothetical protein
MPIPTNFNSWEHFQSVASKVHNKTVRAFFREDLLDDDITSNEGAVRKACLLEDNDTTSQMIAKMLFFALDCGWLEQIIGDNFYGLPKLDLQENYYYKNQVTLLFSETYKDMKKAKRKTQKRFRVTFRWLKELDPEKVTQSDINQLINRINTQFPESYGHYCGSNLYKHYNPKIYDKRFNIPARNQSEVIRFYEKLFRVMELEFDARKLRKSEREVRGVAEYKMILGERIKVNDDLPLATVYLKKVILHLHGKTKKEAIITRYF